MMRRFKSHVRRNPRNTRKSWVAATEKNHSTNSWSCPINTKPVQMINVKIRKAGTCIYIQLCPIVTPTHTIIILIEGFVPQWDLSHILSFYVNLQYKAVTEFHQHAADNQSPVLWRLTAHRRMTKSNTTRQGLRRNKNSFVWLLFATFAMRQKIHCTWCIHCLQPNTHQLLHKAFEQKQPGLLQTCATYSTWQALQQVWGQIHGLHCRISRKPLVWYPGELY